MNDVLIGFGANLGDVRATLQAAEDRLQGFPFTRNLRRGVRLKTSPVGGKPGDADFLNTVFRLEIAEKITPHELLTQLAQTEIELGREPGTRWSARKIDLDLLLFGDRILDDWPRLVVPHPLLPWRRFVLECVAGAAEDMIHPPTGLTLQKLAKRLETAENFHFTEFSPELFISAKDVPHAILIKSDETEENLRKCLRLAREHSIPVLQSRHLSDETLLAALVADVRTRSVSE